MTMGSTKMAGCVGRKVGGFIRRTWTFTTGTP